MAEVLITGGLGYIGSVLAERVVQTGRSCVVLDCDTSKRELFRDLAQVEVVVADLLASEVLTEVMLRHKPQLVYHCAAHSAVGAGSDAIFAENVVTTANLLAAMRACQRLPDLVFASSCSVYGSSDKVCDEQAPLAPVSAYARSKLNCEQLLAKTASTSALAVAVLRYSNVAGATARYGEQRVQETHLIPNLIRAARYGKRVTIFGADLPTPDGTCVRDYVHVSDVAIAHEQATVHLQPGSCQVFNICAGRSHSNLEVVQMVERVSGKCLQLEMAAARRGDTVAVRLANTKAAQQLNFVPSRPLDTIVTDAWAFATQHLS